jgi:hypothetical protein
MHIIEISKVQWLGGKKNPPVRISLPALPWMSRRLDVFWDNDTVFRRHLLECRRIIKQTPEPTDA